MDIVADIRTTLAEDWLPVIYREKVRSQRTRSIGLEIPEKLNAAEINYTLLGIELQVGKRRFACPDLSTARYMRVFARIGCRQFAIPYDITRIPVVADELETAWQRTLLVLAEISGNRPSRSLSQFRTNLVKTIRDEIGEIGAGETMPLFDRETKQRQN